MFVYVTIPETDEVVCSRELADDEVMDCDHFADQAAAALGVEIDHSGGFVPNCCGDLRVEFRPDLANSVVIWSGRSYFFKQEA